MGNLTDISSVLACLCGGCEAERVLRHCSSLPFGTYLSTRSGKFVSRGRPALEPRPGSMERKINNLAITCCHGAQVFACMRPRMDNAMATWSVRRPMCRACRHCSSSLGLKSASISRRMDRRSRSMFCIGLPAAQQPVTAGAWACRTCQGGRQCWRMDTPRANCDNNPFSSGAWTHRTHPGADSESSLQSGSWANHTNRGSKRVHHRNGRPLYCTVISTTTCAGSVAAGLAGRA